MPRKPSYKNITTYTEIFVPVSSTHDNCVEITSSAADVLPQNNTDKMFHTIMHADTNAKKIALPKHGFPGDEKHFGGEPVWDTERAMQMSDDEFQRHLIRSLHYYNYFYSSKDLKKFVVYWLENSTKFPKDFIVTYKNSPDELTPITLCSLVRAHMVGMPLKERHVKYIFDKIESIVRYSLISANETISDNVDKKVEYYKPDRAAEKLAVLLGEIEGELDNLYLEKTSKFKFYEFLTKNNVSVSAIEKIVELLKRHLSGLVSINDTKDSELKESYRFLSKKDRDNIIKQIESFIQDAELFVKAKKVQRKVRVQKSLSKEKIVGRLKYLKNYDQLKVVSINPVDIIGATELYVYDVRRRKLGVYVADESASTLSVKGTSIVGFDPSKSVCKTLRKPEEQVRELIKSGKMQARKFMKDIKAVETKLSGRISADVLLLKVIR